MYLHEICFEHKVQFLNCKPQLLTNLQVVLVALCFKPDASSSLAFTRSHPGDL